MPKDELVDILREMGEEIPEKEPIRCHHGRKRYLCKECDGDGISEHKKQKAFCIICRATQICKHNKEKYGCKICRRIHILREIDRWTREYNNNFLFT